MQEVREFGGEKCLDPLRVLLSEKKMYDVIRRNILLKIKGTYKEITIECFTLFSGQWRPGFYYRTSFDLVFEYNIYSTKTKPSFNVHTEFLGVYITQEIFVALDNCYWLILQKKVRTSQTSGRESQILPEEQHN